MSHLRIVVLGDFHLHVNEYELTERAMEDINACSPDLVVPLGDFGSHEAIGGVEGLQQAYRFLGKLRAPLRPILGNHDMQRETGGRSLQPAGTMERAFLELFGLSGANGVVDTDAARLIFIGTDPQPADSCYIDQECYVTDAHFAELERWLRERGDTPVIVFTHAPPAGAGLRTVPRVHVRATNAYLDQNHRYGRWMPLVRRHPHIRLWFSAHYHLGHDDPDSQTQRHGTTFFMTGVHGSCTRDGTRQSRVIDLDEAGVRVSTLDHVGRRLREPPDWTAAWSRPALGGPAAPAGTGAARAAGAPVEAELVEAAGAQAKAASAKPTAPMEVERAEPSAPTEAETVGTTAESTAPPPAQSVGAAAKSVEAMAVGRADPGDLRLLADDELAGSPSPALAGLAAEDLADKEELRLLADCAIGEQAVLPGGLLTLPGPEECCRCLTATADGFLWEISPLEEAVLGTLHLGPPLSAIAVGADGVWRAWGDTLVRSDLGSLWRFQRHTPLTDYPNKLIAAEPVGALAAHPDGGVWAACGNGLWRLRFDGALPVQTPVHLFAAAIGKLIAAEDGGLYVLTAGGALFYREAADGTIREMRRGVIDWDAYAGATAGIVAGEAGPTAAIFDPGGAVAAEWPAAPDSRRITLLDRRRALWDGGAGCSLWNGRTHCRLPLLPGDPARVDGIARFPAPDRERPRFALALSSPVAAWRPQLQIWEYGDAGPGADGES